MHIVEPKIKRMGYFIPGAVVSNKDRFIPKDPTWVLPA